MGCGLTSPTTKVSTALPVVKRISEENEPKNEKNTGKSCKIFSEFLL